MHEIVNGLVPSARKGQAGPLGILPLGTGNDFSDMAGLPRELGDAARIIAAGKERPIDIGRVGCQANGQSDVNLDKVPVRYFLNNCAVAMEPLVTLEVGRLKYLSGNLRYIVAMFRGFIKLEAWDMRIRWDDGIIESPTYLLSVANSPRTGGLYLIASQAGLDDGRFDFVFAPKMSRLSVLAILPRLFNGTHIKHPKIFCGQSCRLEITSRPGMPLHADGEIIARAATIINVEILPGELRLLVP